MQLKKSETNYYFAIPLQAISIEKYEIKIEEQFGYCSLYYPSNYQDFDDFIYFVKVYDFFSKDILRDFHLIKNQSFLFGESRFIPYIPIRGQMKWILINEESEIRDIDSFSNYKTCNSLTNKPPLERIWYLLQNGGLNGQIEIKSSYESVKHLEFGQLTSEVGVKLRVYIALIKKALESVNGKLSIDEWKELIFVLIRNEAAAKKSSAEDIKSNLIENYIYDWVDVW